jgi:hypothetical protein
MSIVIDIITTLKGGQNIKHTNDSLEKLAKTAKTFTNSFLVEQVITKSLDAFKAETTAITTLTNSLANLGIAYKDIQPAVEKNVDSMANLGFKSTDSLDALAKLTTALGNPAKALEVLSTTADLARFKNQSLGETATQVSKAITGNSRAFADLGLKVDKHLTPQNAFNKLIDQAKSKVGGLAAAYGKTAAGSLDILSAKTEQAKAKLGEGLAPVVIALSSAGLKLIPVLTEISSHIGAYAAVAAGIYLIASAITAATAETEALSFALLSNPLFLAIAAVGGVAALVAYASKNQTKPTASKITAGGRVSGQILNSQMEDGSIKKVKEFNEQTKKLSTTKKQLSASDAFLAKLQKQWAEDAAKQAAAAAKQAADKLKLDRASLALKQASKTLDLQAIEIAAALKNPNLSKHDKDALKLQQAILDQNATAATTLADQIKVLTDAESNLSQHLATPLPEVNNPFQTLTDGATAAMNAIKDLTKAQAASFLSNTVPNMPNGLPFFTGVRPGDVTPSNSSGFNLGTSTPPDAGTPSMSGGITQSGPIIYVQPAIQVNLDGSVITDAVTLQQIQNTASGVAGSYNRTQTFAY